MYVCDRCPDDSIEANECGKYLFNAEQSKTFCCPSYYEQIGNNEYSVMCYSMWEKTFYPKLRQEYERYVNMMYNRMYVNVKYILKYNFPDAHGLEGDYEETFTDKETAIAEAVKASQDKSNYNIFVRKEWFDKMYEKTDHCWIEWEKEAKKERK
jgi:hypothetical protein